MVSETPVPLTCLSSLRAVYPFAFLAGQLNQSETKFQHWNNPIM
jgi:hypothetical protein